MRKAFFWIHLVIGLGLGLVILSMCATGALLAFEPQITRWPERALQTVTPPSIAAKRLDNDLLISKARDAKPDAKLFFIFLKNDPASSAMAGFGREGVLFLNPYTGEVLGKGSRTRDLMNSIENWHRWLGNRRIGKPITGAAAIAFFMLSLSGVYLWWPRKIFTAKGTGHGRNWNRHNTFGIASALFILVITSTGITMSYGLLNKKPAQSAAPRTPQTVKIFVEPPHPQTLRAWITPIHTGRALGVPGQLINLFVALAGLIQIWTGFALAWRRFRKETNLF